MSILRKFILSGTALSVIGLIGILPAIYYQNQNHLAQASSNMIEKPVYLKGTSKLISGKPIQISIKNLDINLPITDGEYDKSTGEWTLSETHVNHAVMSAQANNKGGSTFIYGHYKPGIFANLHNIKPGDKAVITTSNGYKFTYQFRSSKTVSPSDSSVLNYSAKPRLRLQTCTGAWMQNRQVFELDFVKYEKIHHTKSVSHVLQRLSAQLVTPSGSTPAFDIRSESL